MGVGQVSAPKLNLVERGHDRVVWMAKYTNRVLSLPLAGRPTSDRREAPLPIWQDPGASVWRKLEMSSAAWTDIRLEAERETKEVEGLLLIHGHRS